MRKCCYDTSFKKSKFQKYRKSNNCNLNYIFLAPFGKRSWKMFFITLRDLVLYLHKDEHGFRKSQVSFRYRSICSSSYSLFGLICRCPTICTMRYAYITHWLQWPTTTPRSNMCSDCKLPTRPSISFRPAAPWSCTHG